MAVDGFDNSMLDQQGFNLTEHLGAFKALYEQATEPILILSGTVFIECNPSAEEMLGMLRRDIVGCTPFEISPEYQPDGVLSSEKAEALIKEAYRGIPQTFEWVHLNSHGEEFIVEVNLNLFRVGTHSLISVFWRNITLQKYLNAELTKYRKRLEDLVAEKTQSLELLNNEYIRMNKELAAANADLAAANEQLTEEISRGASLKEKLIASEEKFRSFISQAVEGICITNEDWVVVEWNAQMEQLLGVAKSQAVGFRVYDIDSECIYSGTDNRQHILEQHKNIYLSYSAHSVNAGVLSFEMTCGGSGIPHKTLHSYVFPIETSQGRFMGRITRDISIARANELELEGYRIRLEELLNAKTKEANELSLKFKEILRSSPDNVFFFQRNSAGDILYTYFNPMQLRFLGLDPDSVSYPVALSGLVDKEAAEYFKRQYEQCFQSQKAINYIDSTQLNGVDVVYNTSLIPLFNSDGKIVEVAGFSRNISYDTKVRDEQTFTAALFDMLQTLVVVTDSQGRIVRFNGECERLSGYASKEVEGMEFWNLAVTPPNQRERLIARFSTLISGELDSTDIESHWFTKSGELRWIYWKNRALFDDYGEFKFLIATGVDVTNSKRIELKLSESEQQYRTLFESMHSSLAVFKPVENTLGAPPNFEFVEVNPSLLLKLELEYDAIVGHLLSEVVPSLNRGIATDLRLVLQSGEMVTKEVYLPELQLHITYSVFRPREQTVAVMFDDVTAHRALEHEMADREHKFRSIFDGSKDGIAVLNPDLSVYDVNPSVQSIFGVDAGQMMGQSILKFIPEGERDKVSTLMNKMLNGLAIQNFEVELTKAQNESIPIEISPRVIEIANRVAILCVVRDISERKSIENRIIQATIETEERERRLLAADLHDEIGPQLSSLKMYASSLMRKYPDSETGEILTVMYNLIRNSIDNVRVISNNLSPLMLERYGLVAALMAEIEHVKRLLPVKFSTNIESPRFDSKIEIVCYRVAKELLNNTVKYAKAKSADLQLSY
ncbi:MAG: PAS domain S-box protein [Bacteroidales bacterium]|nr:PAS domain S-box protein [Bacteroidales bacterium]MBN2749203.1 PAS domain S-box protein [Bacteroidales bacterium]